MKNRINKAANFLHNCALFLACLGVGILLSYASGFYSRESDATKDALLAESFSGGVLSQMNTMLGAQNDSSIYYIPETNIRGSDPMSSGYKSADSAEDLLDLIAQAQDFRLITEEELCIDPNRLNLTERPVEYYLDESILVICWKEIIRGCGVSFCEVRVKNQSQFKKYLGSNDFYATERFSVPSMAKTVGSVVAMSGDYYAYRDHGVVVYQGKVYRCNPAGLDTCFITDLGDFVILTADEAEGITAEQLEEYVEQNHIRFSISFGPAIVMDGKAVYQYGPYTMGGPGKRNTRAAIGQLGERHYLLCVADRGASEDSGKSIREMADIMAEKGCTTAYCVDGGQTATLYYNQRVYNNLFYGPRPQSDILYFVSAA